jgi:hypothetical protein
MLMGVVFHLIIGLIAVGITNVARRLCPEEKHLVCVCGVLMLLEAIATYSLVG